MKAKDYSDWDATFVAPLSATVPLEMGGLRLDQALARLFHQYSRSRLQDWLRAGHITVDGRVSAARIAVSGGEKILLTPPRLPDSAAPRAQRMPLKIVHEDAALIVIDKPAGLVVHPGAGQPDRTLLNALLAHAPALAGVPRAGIVHRLDKDTSGLLVVAKTVEAQIDLVRQLAERSVARVYIALVQGDAVRVSSQGVSTTVYFRKRQSMANAYGEETGKVMSYLTSVYGLAPQVNLTLVETEDGTPNGYSAPGLVFLSPSGIGNQVGTRLLVNQLARQWWSEKILRAAANR